MGVVLKDSKDGTNLGDCAMNAQAFPQLAMRPIADGCAAAG